MSTNDTLRGILESALDVIKQGDFSTGYCCCGSSMGLHGIGDGHSPVDYGEYNVSRFVESASASLAEPVSGGVVLPERVTHEFFSQHFSPYWQQKIADAYNQALDDVAALNGGAVAGQHSGAVVPHSAQWPTMPGLSQKPREVAAWLHEWRAGNAGGIVVSLAQMSLEGLRRSRGKYAKIVSSDPLYKADGADIGLQYEVVTEHSGCGYGCQVDQITVRLFRGDKVLIVRAPSKAPAKAEPGAGE